MIPEMAIKYARQELFDRMCSGSEDKEYMDGGSEMLHSKEKRKKKKKLAAK